MELKVIDAHGHIHGKEFDVDREEVISRMRENSVGLITVGCSLEDSEKAVSLAEKYENIWATIGIHPTDTKEIFNEKDFESLIKSPKVVAIGECGLDYFRLEGKNEEEEKKKQKENFLKQINFAAKYNKPLMVHCRSSAKSNDAHEDMLLMLSNKNVKGNIHFFTGSREIAEKYFALGFTVSIPGVVTFAEEVTEVVKSLPMENILVETDCPYASPIPHRGKRNEPSFVFETAKFVANIKEMSLEDALSQLLINTKQIFELG